MSQPKKWSRDWFREGEEIKKFILHQMHPHDKTPQSQTMAPGAKVQVKSASSLGIDIQQIHHGAG